MGRYPLVNVETKQTGKIHNAIHGTTDYFDRAIVNGDVQLPEGNHHEMVVHWNSSTILLQFRFGNFATTTVDIEKTPLPQVC